MSLLDSCPLGLVAPRNHVSLRILSPRTLGKAESCPSDSCLLGIVSHGIMSQHPIKVLRATRKLQELRLHVLLALSTILATFKLLRSSSNFPSSVHKITFLLGSSKGHLHLQLSIPRRAQFISTMWWFHSVLYRSQYHHGYFIWLLISRCLPFRFQVLLLWLQIQRSQYHILLRPLWQGLWFKSTILRILQKYQFSTQSLQRLGFYYQR